MAKTRQKAAREALKTIRTALKHWCALPRLAHRAGNLPTDACRALSHGPTCRPSSREAAMRMMLVIGSLCFLVACGKPIFNPIHQVGQLPWSFRNDPSFSLRSRPHACSRKKSGSKNAPTGSH